MLIFSEETILLLFDTPFVRQILDEHPISQIVSVVGIVTIVWYLYAGEGPLLHRARDTQGAGIFVMLPLGFKAILLYILFCYVCYYAIPPSLLHADINEWLRFFDRFAML